MPAAIFSRMRDRLLEHFGDEGRLRGAIACKAAIEHGVEIQGEYGEVVLLRSVATLSKDLGPVAGDMLEFGSFDETGAFTAVTTYYLDAKLADNGFSVRYILREA